MKIVALDIGGTEIKSSKVDASGVIIEDKIHQTNAKLGGPHVIQKAMEIVESYEDFDAIGISTAGLVDSERGIVIYANENIPNYTGTKLKEIFEEKFKVPTAVENDAFAAAIGEAHFGAGKGSKDFLCLTYGTGIGGAIVIDGSIYKGMDGIAGEFGHITTHPNGKACGCGLKGCYEQYASTRALIEVAQKYDAECTNGKVVFQKFNDSNIVEIIDRWIDEIVIGIVTLTHIFNPSTIIMGGGIMNEDYIIDAVQKKTHQRIMDVFKNVRIYRAALGNRAGMLGVAHMASML